MEGGIFLCHWYFLLRAYLQKRKLRYVESESERAETPKAEGQDGKVDGKEPESEPPATGAPVNPIFALSQHDVV
jgi:hypothetical protein